MTKLTAERGEPSDAQPLGGHKEVEADPVTLAGLVFETATGLRRLLARSPGRRLRMSDLAAQTALTPSGLTRAIDRLVDAGLVCRHACPEDRRGAFAALSQDGTERMEMALGCHSRQLNDLLEGVLDAGERVHLTVLLRRLRDHVNPGAARVSEA
jgi:DNA-binding MarR family transcriptional regulator